LKSLTHENIMRDHNIDRRYFIECVLTSGQQLFLLGWIDDTETPLTRVTLETLDGQRRSYSLNGPLADGKCMRTTRPDVHKSLRLSSKAGCQLGFAIALSEQLIEGTRAIVSFDGFEQSAQLITPESSSGASTALAGLLVHSGYALREMAIELHANRVVEWIDRARSVRRSASQTLVVVESALNIAGRSLLVIGWIGASADQIANVRVQTSGRTLDVTASLVRVQRPDLFARFPKLAPLPLGFFLLIDSSELANSTDFALDVETAHGYQSATFAAEVAGWPDVLPQLKDNPSLAERLFAAFDASRALRSLHGYADDIAWLRREGIAAMAAALPRSIHNSLSTVAAIDRVISFAGGGVLIVGWHHEPQARLKSVQVIGSDGSLVEVRNKMFSMPRNDVRDALLQQFPGIGENCGFILFVPSSGRDDGCRALRLELDNGCVEWLQVQTTECINTGNQLLRALSASLGDISKLDSTIFEFFESGFGATIERLSIPPKADANARVERQFGQPTAAADVSVIVPLYGRCDFLRYQLAHFADDPDFARVDLIYVVDDPTIVAETLTLASHYESLFRVPFRVVHYGQNLGFAAANNIGAQLAKAPLLLLLNSDVLPTARGWITTLADALQRLPSARAVGPLLLFADGSVQHAGMRAMVDPALPGFLWNSHPGKGAPWRGGTEPSAQTLLTAACLMVRTADYRALGGLDEGYLIGDFEDSDFCLKLARGGRTLWLVPEARLWHLERQSQAIGLVPTRRRLLTFYNGWRYKKRIDRGELPHPLRSGADPCAS
jgi:GT2 family glycosyltransferase